MALSVTDDPYAIPNLAVGDAKTGTITNTAFQTPSTITQISDGPVNTQPIQLASNLTGESGSLLGLSQYNPAVNQGGGGTAPAAPAGPDLGGERSGVLGLINQANKAYNRFFGLIDKAIGDQSGRIRENAQRAENETRLEGQQLQEASDRAYAARGLADSSFIARGRADIGRAVEGQVADIGRQELEGLAELGQLRGQEEAFIRAGISSLDDFKQQANEITDLVGLQNLATQLNDLLRTLTQNESNYGTQGEFLNKVSRVAPFNKVRNNMNLLLNDPSATTEMKTQIIRNNIVNDPELEEEEKANLWAEWLGMIGVEEEEVEVA